MLRPLPNHGTQQLPNDDDDDIYIYVNMHACMHAFAVSMHVNRVYVNTLYVYACMYACMCVYACFD